MAGLEARPAHVLCSALKAARSLVVVQTIGDVLDACGNNIDVAIKQLGQLRLTAHCGTAQPDTPTAGNQQTVTPASVQAQGRLPCFPIAVHSLQNSSSDSFKDLLHAASWLVQAPQHQQAQAHRHNQSQSQSPLNSGWRCWFNRWQEPETWQMLGAELLLYCKAFNKLYLTHPSHRYACTVAA